MGTTVQARLDKKAEAALRVIAKSEGWTASQVIRNQCRSAAGDLATNKKHMEGFGKKWRVDKQGNGKWDW